MQGMLNAGQNFLNRAVLRNRNQEIVDFAIMDLPEKRKNLLLEQINVKKSFEPSTLKGAEEELLGKFREVLS